MSKYKVLLEFEYHFDSESDVRFHEVHDWWIEDLNKEIKNHYHWLDVHNVMVALEEYE